MSTTAAFVAAGAGRKVAKHGNRLATSQCGSADVLEALGASIELEPVAVAECIDGIGFDLMFAPRHHQAMRHVVPVRKELGVRTIFNFLGPLTNPAGARRQVIGVSDGRFETIAAALGELGTEMALVVSSADGLDGLCRLGGDQRRGAEGRGAQELRGDPGAGQPEWAPDGAAGAGTPGQNAAVLRGVLSGNSAPSAPSPC